jgi:hypothetical protein
MRLIVQNAKRAADCKARQARFSAPLPGREWPANR